MNEVIHVSTEEELLRIFGNDHPNVQVTPKPDVDRPYTFADIAELERKIKTLEWNRRIRASSVAPFSSKEQLTEMESRFEKLYNDIAEVLNNHPKGLPDDD